MFDINRLRQLYTLGGEDYGINTEPTFPNDMGIQPEQSPIQVPSYKTPSTEADDFISQLNKFYTPEHTSRDRYNSLLSNMPQRDDNISFGRKLVAGGMGLDARQRRGTPGQEMTATASPVETMEKVMHAPYIRDVMAWKEQLEPNYKAADLENRANINERTLAGNLVTSRAQDKRLESNERIARDKNETALIRANAYAAKNRGAEIEIEDGQIIAKYPEGRVEFLGKVPGSSTEAELANIRGKWNVDAARQRGADAITATNIRESPLVKDSSGRTFKWDAATGKYAASDGSDDQPKGDVTIVGTPSQSRTTSGTTNTLETNRQRQNKLRDLYEADPAARKYITRGTNGTFAFKNRPALSAGGFFSNEVKQEELDAYDALKREVDPTYVPPVSSPNSISDYQPDNQKQKTDRVQSPDGRTGTWDYSKGPLPPGFKVIK